MNLQVLGIYSFSVYPVAVLGTNFKNVQLRSILSADDAQAMGFDIIAQNALMSASLPSAIQTTDPTKYTYLRLKFPSGQTQIIAQEWINPATLQTVNLGRHTVTIDNSSSSDGQKILDVLAANNFTVSKIDFQSAT